MSPRLAPVLSGADLPHPELQAARLDGEVFAIDECFSPIDEIEQRHHRGRALASVFDSRFIAERMSAAWVHGAEPRPPHVHEFCVPNSRRAHPTSTPRTVIREVAIADDEYMFIGGLTVTTPLRTAIDIARADDELDESRRRALVSLVAMVGLEKCVGYLASRGSLPGKVAALRRLAAAAAESDQAETL